MGELASGLSRRISSVVRSLETLRDADLVAFRAAEGDKRTGRGHPSGWWSLTETGLEQAETPLGPPDMPARSNRSSIATHEDGGDPGDDPGRTGPWEIERHQAFAKATVDSTDLAKFFQVLSLGEHAAETSFVARLDGDVRDYLFVFDSRLGARPAETLAASLGAVGVPCSIGSVADVRGFGALVGDAQAATMAAASASKSLATRPQDPNDP